MSEEACRCILGKYCDGPEATLHRPTVKTWFHFTASDFSVVTRQKTKTTELLLPFKQHLKESKNQRAFFFKLDQFLLNEGKNTAVAKRIQQLQLSVPTWAGSTQTGLL